MFCCCGGDISETCIGDLFIIMMIVCVARWMDLMMVGLFLLTYLSQLVSRMYVYSLWMGSNEPSLSKWLFTARLFPPPFSLPIISNNTVDPPFFRSSSLSLPVVNEQCAEKRKLRIAIIAFYVVVVFFLTRNTNEERTPADSSALRDDWLTYSINK